MEDSKANNRVDKAGKGKATMERTFRTNNLISIMERALPPRAMIHQDAVDAVDQCAAEFAAMITIAATEQRKKGRREVMSADDLIKAMEMLGYDHYVGPLTKYLRGYRECKGTVRRGDQERAMSAVALETGEMAPSQVPEASVVTKKIPMYDFMGLDQAQAAREMEQRQGQRAVVASVTGEMPPTPPHSSDFTLGLPMYNITVQGQSDAFGNGGVSPEQ